MLDLEQIKQVIFAKMYEGQKPTESLHVLPNEKNCICSHWLYTSYFINIMTKQDTVTAYYACQATTLEIKF